ncbi:hypothetical protein SAMN04515671_3790 [Nakamurella panacisegetis]|uniref:DUF1345 domain-containing protein n=1 Tax=Nakamurella panacisegetis TaxID=1090615 RepID=A0A1H0RX92_9ACTN|nr:hypothetical protein [Nakamurella panacisegetis]SDP34005.1 hypothetical protein SAMN04515671_3790 [Nakamurella panacisegetis]
MPGQNNNEEEIPVSAHPGHRSRQDGRGENRLPPALAVVLAGLLYALLPGPLLLGPRLLVPILELALLVALIGTNPWRLTRETRWSRRASIGLAILIAVANVTALGLLIHQLVNSSVKSGSGLLLAALQVWVTNVIAFGLLYWELDRGGPVARSQLPRNQIPLADVRFSHDEDRDTVVEVSRGSSKVADWMPTFVDYFYLSVTNSSAFGPTDTMPLSSRFKILMGIQATAALLTSLLVIARAVGALT